SVDMALGDLMVSRFSQSSVSLVSNHRYDEDCVSSHDDGDSRRKDSEAKSSSSYGNGTTEGAATATSMAYLPQTIVLCELRHDASEASAPLGTSEIVLVPKWRLKERMKTGCVALVLCLNITVDPPDVIKISPCARIEAWIDPFSMAPPKALETIGKNLSTQYERWQPRARYKVQLDPTVDEVRKLCLTCRKYAKTERVLFHYNGHGVPKPTANGEIWVFNKSYTQYIPLPISELDSWLKTPSIYVFDCSAARMILNAFAELHDWGSSGSSGSSRDCILLAACDVHETLPQSVEFPADVFTSCLTTPIKMALKWFCRRSLLKEIIDESLIDRIPGRQNDRKTLLGELNWIFTAVTDTIAWNVLPHELFQRLFRQDLLVASLFRNFLLAERIMRSANCNPISHPMLPPTHQHHMWDAWDMAAEICLSQLPQLVLDPSTEFQPSPFFTEQLTAFEVWLDHGSEHKKPPEQLPIVLQVLLSQCHRFRALVLLGRFLDMGSWAVDLALSVGIFPYVLKLLQTTTNELRQILVFIWTKILALDKSCQIDLVKDGGHTYFIRFLDSSGAFPEQRAMAAFVLAVIVDGHRRGQEACLEANLIGVCLGHLEASRPSDPQPEPLFLQWLCLCLGKLWEDFMEAQIMGREANAFEKLAPLLSEPQPEVRAAAVFALGTLLDIGFDSNKSVVEDEFDDDEKIRAEDAIIKSLLDVVSDGSPLVRAEVAVALARFAFGHKQHLKLAAASYWKPQSSSLLTSLPSIAKFHDPGSATIVSLHMSPLTRASTDSQPVARESRISSSPLGSSGLMQGSPLSDDSSLHSDSGMMHDSVSNGAVHQPRLLDNAVYSQCVRAMFALAKDPSPRIASLGRRVLSIIGIEQVVAKPSKPTGRPGEAADSGLADPLLGASGSERSLLPLSTIYGWSCGHFSKPLLGGADASQEIAAKREEKEKFALEHIAKCQHSSISKLNNNPIANWDTRFETGTKTALLHPFSPIVVAADENERIRVWNYEEATLLNGFDNHDFPDKGISKLCLINELDDSLLLVASCDGSVRIWKNYATKGKQKLVTGFSSIQGHKPGARDLNAVVDWQQQSGYLYASGETSTVTLWDLEKEQLVRSVPSESECGVTALSASQVHGGQLAAGFADGSLRLYDVRSPEPLVCATRPHQKVERVVGLSFQPGLDPAKVVSASQAGDIQFLDLRTTRDTYLTIDAHRGSLTALAVHRHAPIIASGSAKQLIKVFSLQGEQLGIIRYYPSFMAQKIGSVSCLTFHPYQVLLAAGAADSFVSIYTHDNSQAR
uniref:Regulatory-associated protein of TOR 1 n=1 Tax=Arabidopsis thaliana TaxID=3702 RepID=UPI000C6C885F|nr:Chain A, Regulatory-associated protein of TOR 1 [Arabidopsis thaliana]5WBJ_A Chain A, Regulatory-associated protein of TOR 1 [Arabidopsis thaliana]5WBK_A Chain A, Regulatory-associated protein of TOR 1 [Arabidopsis thaliana]5WBL_A Chain A, Regulatory-associated protein of TOR 1 [Arabidopsis thaliana]